MDTGIYRFLLAVQAGFGLYPFRRRGRIRYEPLQSRWKSQRWCYSFPLLLDMERTGPEVPCSNKMQAHGKWFSSEPSKLLILAEDTDVQLHFSFTEKKNHIEIRDRKWFVTTCLEKRCLKIRKACMEFSFCTQMQKPVKQTLLTSGDYCYAARNNATEQKLLRDTCCSPRKFVH